jgi:serine phosphatase RsbU (regulator of sigma subunit)
MLPQQGKTPGFVGRISEAFKKPWQRLSDNFLFWVGYCNAQKQRPDSDSGNQALNLIARAYFELSLNESDTIVGEYLISKIVTSNDIVGADYVSLKHIYRKDEIASIIVGDIIGHGIERSPGAIITMAAFHSMESNNVIEIQTAINRVLFNVNKNLGGKSYCLSLLIKKNGVIEYAGKAESLALIAKHKRLELKQNGEILGVTENLKYTKRNVVQLGYGDILIIRTDGAVFDDKDDDKTVVMITRNRHFKKDVIASTSRVRT